MKMKHDIADVLQTSGRISNLWEDHQLEKFS